MYKEKKEFVVTMNSASTSVSVRDTGADKKKGDLEVSAFRSVTSSQYLVLIIISYVPFLISAYIFVHVCLSLSLSLSDPLSLPLIHLPVSLSFLFLSVRICLPVRHMYLGQLYLVVKCMIIQQTQLCMHAYA